jgi:hypothetical protein
VLPQVLAGLGVFSVLSAGCLLWLQRLQPGFFSAALAALVYQIWLVRRQPAALRTAGVKAILGASVAANVLLVFSWVILWLRYR